MELLQVCGIGILLACLHHLFADDVRPSIYKDEPRYINYALSMVQHGTFGISHNYKTNVDTPGAANTPAYPLLLAAAAYASPALENTLLCVQQDPIEQSGCGQGYAAVLMLQYGLCVLVLVALWIMVRFWQPNDVQSWVFPTLAVLLAAFSGVLFDAARELRTEILILALFAWFLVAWQHFLNKPTRIVGVGLGVTLGLLTLTRPEYLYLTGFLVIAGLFWAPARKQIPALLVVFAITLSPWLARNQLHFGAPLLTASSYGDTVLVQRLTYNRMESKHWIAAFVFFLPDSGDDLAAALFPQDWYAPLKDTANNSFMSQWIEDQRRVRAEAGDAGALGYLLTQQVLPQAPWHVMTSIPLAWRGLFVGKYFGVLGLLALCWWLFRDTKARWWMLPIAFLVALHAGVSISIPRYNIMLLFPYVIALILAAQHQATRHQRKFIETG
ncbi:MAG: hypothetical protein AAF541_18575 [Pseudomonadota bacterium]